MLHSISIKRLRDGKFQDDALSLKSIFKIQSPELTELVSVLNLNPVSTVRVVV